MVWTLSQTLAQCGLGEENEDKKSRWSPSPIDIRKLKGVISAFSASDKNRISGRGGKEVMDGRVGHRNSRSSDEIQQRNMLNHVCIHPRPSPLLSLFNVERYARAAREPLLETGQRQRSQLATTAGWTAGDNRFELHAREHSIVFKPGHRAGGHVDSTLRGTGLHSVSKPVPRVDPREAADRERTDRLKIDRHRYEIEF
ncbi:hypothetical protein EVAR_26531_1 [Eumeta japonica]|uniref:Uncharacterized protein n=1 Tax=Eumeta variegata TaxID=151549 RepID=A0A4C1YN80_EUMVA|nr:hypothetical protein EVAR_26531_1 [Eumeta japonica]